MKLVEGGEMRCASQCMPMPSCYLYLCSKQTLKRDNSIAHEKREIEVREVEALLRSGPQLSTFDKFAFRRLP